MKDLRHRPVPALAVCAGLVGRADLKIVSVTLNRQGSPQRSGSLLKISLLPGPGCRVLSTASLADHYVSEKYCGYRLLCPGTSQLPELS